MGVEGGGEAVHEIEDGIVSVHAAILPAAAESRSGHAVRHCGYSGSVADTGAAACQPRGGRPGPLRELGGAPGFLEARTGYPGE